MNKEITLKIEYLNEKGFGVGFIEGKEYWILNAITGEEVKAKVFKRKKGIKYGIAHDIIKRSQYRIDPKEDHYLSCSPWQILENNYELQVKNELIRRFYKDHADFNLPDFVVESFGNEFNYRNKVEFGFYGDAETEELHLSFHKREGSKAKYCLDSCLLIAEPMNISAQRIVKFLNEKKVIARQLKGLLLRYSFYEKKVIGAIYVKDETLEFTESEINSLLDENLKGLLVIHSDRKSPAYIETKRLITAGDEDLVEKILDFKFHYPYDGFFQVNPKVFELALLDILKHIDVTGNVVDLYSGVGTIGLNVANAVYIGNLDNKVIGVELFEKSLKYATKNAKENKLENCFEFIQNKSENTELGVLNDADILIVDPPRTGLHPKLIEEIKKIKPRKLIYLSCNPKTQAQDFMHLKEIYDVIFFKAYNFYPNTPHVEALMVLEIRN